MAGAKETPLPKGERRGSSECDGPEGRFLAAARGRGAGRPPIWLMRQAGRYLPQYREVRAEHSFVEMCSEPELAREVSLQPWREFEPDAVIVFYDILFLPEAMGAPLEYTERGPVFHRPVRTAEDVRALRVPEPGEGISPILDTLRRLRAELPPQTALLGFAGAPFTLASYLVEGDFRRNGDRIRRLLYAEPAVVEELIEKLAQATAGYLEAQVDAGADAVQLFDTWAGLLSAEQYDRFALPAQQASFEPLARRGTPIFLYVNGGGHLTESMARSGARGLSLDWRVDLRAARERLGRDIVLQGNLDPAALFARPEEVRRLAGRLLETMGGDPAWIFNLGHGVLPETPVESVRALFETVREFSP